MNDNSAPFYSWDLNELETHELWAWSQCFSPEECQKIIDIGKSLTLLKATVGGDFDEKSFGLNTEIRSSNIAFIPVTEDNKWIFQRITQIVNRMNTDYFHYDLREIETLQFTEYDSSYTGFYDRHIDMIYRSFKTRKLSITIQLSDQGSYEGGDLVLYSTSKPTYTKREQGIANIFPSWSLHEVTPVTKGTRYSLVAWILGPRFK